MADMFAQEMEMARAMVEARLAEYFTDSGLEEAMRYSLMAGGKRIRPILTMKFCEAAAEPWKRRWTLDVVWKCCTLTL